MKIAECKGKNYTIINSIENIKNNKAPIMEIVYRDATTEEVLEINKIHETNFILEAAQEDKIEAQCLYTALMTDTLLEGE